MKGGYGMALLERVTTLIKANINDLVSKAEHPEKLLRQLLLDMENQYMQVKTQVAIAIADQHRLERKYKESGDAQQEWVHKAQLALEKGDETLARAALEQSLTHENTASNFRQLIEEQSHQVDLLKNALHRLQTKMAETRSDAEVLIARHRSARISERAGKSLWEDGPGLRDLAERVSDAEATGAAWLAVGAEDSAQRQLADLERNDRIEKLMAELKQKSA
jgi:phage shock protein A